MEGVLDDYTVKAEIAHRDIALRPPIVVTMPNGDKKKPKYDHLVVPGEHIRHIAIAYLNR